MPDIEINSQTAFAYLTVEEATAYIEFTPMQASWAGEGNDTEPVDDDVRGRALVTASRNMDTKAWGAAYATQEARGAVQAIKDGCAEWAALIVQDPSNANPYPEPQANVRTSVGSVDFQNSEGIPTSPVSGVADDAIEAGRLNMPTSVYAILKPYLAEPPGDEVGQPSPPPTAFSRVRTTSEPRTLDDFDYA